MSLDKVLFSKYKSVGIIADKKSSADSIFYDKVKFAFENLPKWLTTDQDGKPVYKVITDRV